MKKVYIAGPDVFRRDAKQHLEMLRRMIDECDAVIANIEPFRGPHMDPGTAFEIGYAVAKGKPVYCYTTQARDENGDAIEDFGLTENLMIDSPARAICINFVDAVSAMKADLAPKQPDDYEEHA